MNGNLARRTAFSRQSEEEIMLRKFALVVIAAGGLGLMALPPANAAPAAPGLQPTIQSDVEQVRHRRCHVRRNSRWVRCPHWRRPYRYYGYPYYYPGPYWGPWGPPAPWPFFPFFPW
jgi:hypothetical protein